MTYVAWIPGLTPEPTLVSDAAVDAVAGWKGERSLFSWIVENGEWRALTKLDWMPASIPGSLAIGVGGSALAVGTVAYMLHHRSSNKKVLAVMRRELVEAVSENARMREELQGVFKHVAEELHRNKKFLPAADAEDVLLLTITSTEDLKTQFGSLLAYIVRLSISNSEATEKCQQLQKNAVTLRTEIKNTKEQLETAKSELVDERKDKQQLGLKVQKLQFDNRSVKEQLHTIQADLETNTADFEIERSGLRDQLEDTKGDLKNSAQQEEYLRTKLTRLEETAQRREEAHNAEVQTLMASSEADKAEIQSLKEQLKEKGDELADVRDANVRLEVEKTELEEKVASMALEPSQERIQRLKKDKEDLEEKVNVLSSAKADLESELSKSEEAMKGLEASVQDLTSVKDSLESSISTSEKDKKDLQEEVAGLALANASLKSTNTIFESSLTESETHSKELQKQVQSIKATNEVLKRSVEQAKKTNMKLENKVQGLTTENTDLKSQNACLGTQVTGLTDSLQAAEKSNTDLKSQNTCLGTQVTGLTDSLQAAEKSNEDLETEVSGLKMDKVNSGMAAEQSQRLIGGLQKQNGALHEQVTDLESRNKAGEDSLKQMKHLETSNQELTSKVQYFMTARNTQEASNRQLKTENEALKGHQATLQETVRSLRSENNASQKRQLEAESLTPNKGTDFGNARYHDLPMRTSLSTGKLQFQNSKLQQQLEEARAATSTQQPEPAFVWPLGSGDAGLFQTRPELGMDTADKPKVALPPKSGPVDDPNSTEELDQTKDTADKPKVALPPKSGRVYDANSTEEQNQVEDGEDGSSVGDPEAPPTVRKKRRQQRSVQNAKTRMARLREKTEMICDNKIRFEHIDFEALAAKCTGFPKEQLDEAVEEA